MDDDNDPSVDAEGQASPVSTAVRWEPWAPEIGQRVKIRLSAECPLLRAAPGEKETKTAWHSHSEDGMVGTVVRPTPGVWMPRMDLPGHPYLVDLSPNAVHFQGCISFGALYFAAPELDVVDDAPRSAEDA
jgi:hypothetical protein